MIFGSKWGLCLVLKSKFQVRFKKDFRKYQYHQAIIDELDTVLALLLAKKKLPEKYRDHSLTGNYVGFRECHIKPDVLLVYKTDGESLILARLGSHSELF